MIIQTKICRVYKNNLIYLYNHPTAINKFEKDSETEFDNCLQYFIEAPHKIAGQQQCNIKIYTQLTFNQTMSYSTESKYLSRANTTNLGEGLRMRSRIHKRMEGNSQFIRSKFDMDYDPKVRVIKTGKSPFYQPNSEKRYLEQAKLEELLELTVKAQEEIKSGKKIVIDWNKKDKFRTTRFPSLGQPVCKSRRVHTEQMAINKSQYLKVSKRSDILSRMFQNPTNKEITSKSEHLCDLLSDSITEKQRKRYRIKCFSTQGSQKFDSKNTSWNLSGISSIKEKDPHFNYSIIEEVEEKRKQFFQTNNQKIKKAIEYEKYMGKPIKQEYSAVTKKEKIQEVEERIIHRSKLVLLKSELAKKFKQIKEVILEGPETSNQKPKEI